MLAFLMKRCGKAVSVADSLVPKMSDPDETAESKKAKADLLASLDDLRTKMMSASGRLDLKKPRDTIGSKIAELFTGEPAKPMLVRQKSYSAKGAEDVEQCRDYIGRYLSVLKTCEQTFLSFELTDWKGNRLNFEWCDAFDATPSEAAFWSFERACVTFNLASVLCFLGTHQKRGTDDGVRGASHLFQQAAGALAEVSHLAKAASWSLPNDLSALTLAALEQLMLAQAQKTFFEKAENDQMSHAVCSKLAAEAAALYASASTLMAEAKKKSYASVGEMDGISPGWTSIIEWNRIYFDALQHYYLVQGHLKANEHGAQISRLTHAYQQLTALVAAIGTSNVPLRDYFAQRMPAMADELAKCAAAPPRAPRAHCSCACARALAALALNAHTVQCCTQGQQRQRIRLPREGRAGERARAA